MALLLASQSSVLLNSRSHAVQKPQVNSRPAGEARRLQNGLLENRCEGVLARSILPKILDPQSPDKPLSAQGITIPSVTSALFHANEAWIRYDVDKSGTLSLEEAVDLLNSYEVRDAMLLLTNIAPTTWTVDELRPFFQRADHDKSGALSRSEFLALYLLVSTHRIIENPVVLAEALLGFLDSDRNGKIEGKELKVLLTMLGFPAAMLLPIPAHLGVDYRAILKTVKAGKKDGATTTPPSTQSAPSSTPATPPKK